jgi:hypothetical protein
MLKIAVRILTVLFAFIIASVARANSREDGRHVDGGDLLYTVSIVSYDIDAAIYDAQMQIAHLVETECGVVHKSLIFYLVTSANLDTQDRDKSSSATVQGGLPIGECQQAKDAKDKYALENHVLAKRYREYVSEHSNGGNQVKKSTEAKKAALKLNSNLAEIRKNNEETQSKLESIVNQIEHLAARFVPPPVTERAPAATQEKDPPQSYIAKQKAQCQAKKKRLLFRAIVAANDNNPPGNMADGEAYELSEEARLMDCD